jgi:large subunit ribosomal protein L18
MDKNESRLRRARRTRAKIKSLGVHRLTVHRTPRHIYAQIIAPGGATVLVSASTIEKSVGTELEGCAGNVVAATLIGRLVAERALAAGIASVAFDRSGYRYHGRVKALAEAARAAGLQF